MTRGAHSSASHDSRLVQQLVAVPIQQGVQCIVRDQPASFFQTGRELPPPVRKSFRRYVLPPVHKYDGKAVHLKIFEACVS
eukprot:scaffold207_cov409-Prasinococcus_capsulatus_cf.AAC.41